MMLDKAMNRGFQPPSTPPTNWPSNRFPPPLPTPFHPLFLPTPHTPQGLEVPFHGHANPRKGGGGLIFRRHPHWRPAVLTCAEFFYRMVNFRGGSAMTRDLFNNTPPQPPRRGRPMVTFNQQKQQLARTMLMLGMNQEQISEIFGLSIPTLRRLLSHLPEWNPRGHGPRRGGKS